MEPLSFAMPVYVGYTLPTQPASNTLPRLITNTEEARKDWTRNLFTDICAQLRRYRLDEKLFYASLLRKDLLLCFWVRGELWRLYDSLKPDERETVSMRVVPTHGERTLSSQHWQLHWRWRPHAQKDKEWAQDHVRLPAFAFDPTRTANVYNGMLICTASKLEIDDPRTIKYEPLPDGTMPPPKKIRRYLHGEIVPDDTMPPSEKIRRDLHGEIVPDDTMPPPEKIRRNLHGEIVSEDAPDSPIVFTNKDVPSRPDQGDSIDGPMESPDGYVEDDAENCIALCVGKYNPEYDPKHNAEHNAEHDAEHDAEHEAELITELMTKLMTKIKAKLKKELKKELEKELKAELEKELKKELKAELKKELRKELKAELKEKLKKKIKKELKKELTAEHEPEHDADVQPEFQPPGPHPEPTEESFKQPAQDPMNWLGIGFQSFPEEGMVE